MLQSDFEEAYDPDLLEVVHINVDNTDAAALHEHWDVYNPGFPVLAGCMEIYPAFGNGALPYNVVLGPEGVVDYTFGGFDIDALHHQIARSTDVESPLMVLRDYRITSVFPNPFNPDAKVSIHLEHPGEISLLLYNSLGQTVYRQFLGPRAAGTSTHVIEAGSRQSGVYFLDLRVAGQSRDLRKVTILK